MKLPAGARNCGRPSWTACRSKPQREDERVLIDVPAGKADAAQTLQIVYAAPVGAVALCGTVDTLVPKLLLRENVSSRSA